MINYGDPDFKNTPWVLLLPLQPQIDIANISSWARANREKPCEIREQSSEIISYKVKARQLDLAIRKYLSD